MTIWLLWYIVVANPNSNGDWYPIVVLVDCNIDEYDGYRSYDKGVKTGLDPKTA